MMALNLAYDVIAHQRENRSERATTALTRHGLLNRRHRGCWDAALKEREQNDLFAS